jgi:hypothetical protein
MCVRPCRSFVRKGFGAVKKWAAQRLMSREAQPCLSSFYIFGKAEGLIYVSPGQRPGKAEEISSPEGAPRSAPDLWMSSLPRTGYAWELEFEWDPNKEARAKHGVSFKEAETVFDDSSFGYLSRSRPLLGRAAVSNRRQIAGRSSLDCSPHYRLPPGPHRKRPQARAARKNTL